MSSRLSLVSSLTARRILSSLVDMIHPIQMHQGEEEDRTSLALHKPNLLHQPAIDEASDKK